MRKKLFIIFSVLVLAGWAVYHFLVSPYLRKMSEVRVVAFDQELTLFMGGGGNSGVFSGSREVYVIDTKMAEPSTQLFNHARQLAGERPIVVINTHIHPDHVSGNWLYKGSRIYAGANYTPEVWKQQASAESLPTNWVKDRLEIDTGNETIVLYNFNYPAHTQSDMVVYFKKRNLIFTGDLVLNSQAPALMEKNLASIQGYLNTMDELPNLFRIETIVPGHGHTGGPDLIRIFRGYFLDMRQAASEPGRRDELEKKYSDWVQFPGFMSTSRTIEYIQKTEKK